MKGLENIERSMWITDRDIKEILALRDEYDVDTEEWKTWNELKADWLEHHKPSNKEEIIYFKETALLDIPGGFSVIASLPMIPFHVMKRSLLEHHPENRHPIPYAIVKHKRRYFFILREKGSGELRLIGKKGMLGGHVGVEDIDQNSLNKTILNGLMRELNEEAGIDASMITGINIKGLIKSDEGVDADHLGVVYEIELDNDEIDTQEEGVQKGIWIHENDLENHNASFESWSQIVYNHILRDRN
jgi:predicted NUDIX family phosphoesterase